MDNEEKVTYFAETDARNKRIRFGIKSKDRARHVYCIGKTGMGKSTFLENLAIQDIQNGEGLAFIDPHGKSADLLLEYIPEHRKKDVIYFAPFDLDFPIAFNVLEDVGPEKRHLVANGLMSAFKKIWVDAWSARMEYILNNIMLALLEYPGSTLMSVNRMLTDKDFRNTVVANISDPSVKSFWVDEYAKYTEKFAAEAAPAIQNKVGQFVANPLVRNIVGQPKSSFDIREMMDNKKIFIINLSKGRVGEANANLLGAMLITKIYLAAMSRADLKEDEIKKVPQFYLYVDEFQNFANETFADILSEARKYKLSLTIANQYVEQMSEEVRAAVFGNVGTMIAFRIGAYDAAVFEKEYAPEFTAEDLVNLQQYQMYLKLMIDGVTSRPFSAIGMPPIPKPDISYTNEILNLSREKFANPREKIEEDIRNWHIQKIGAKEPASRASSVGGSGAGSRGTDGRSVEGRNAEGRSAGGRSADNRSDRPSRADSRERITAPRGRSLEGAGERSRDRVSERPIARSSERSSTRASERPMSDRPVIDDRMEHRTTENRADEHRVDEHRKENRAEHRTEHRVEHREDNRPAPIEEKVVHVIADADVNVSENTVSKRISLNSLSSNVNNTEKAKNNQKTINPENVAALRNALLSVMGENSDDKKELEKKVEIAPENNAKLSDDKGEYRKEEKKEEPRSQPNNDDKKSGALSPDDLKRILDINE